MGKVDDPNSFKEAMSSEYSHKWIEALEEELKSMSTNKVWDLVEISEGAKKIGCKWVYKTKYDSKEKIERFKARLVAKGFTQRRNRLYRNLLAYLKERLVQNHYGSSSSFRSRVISDGR